MLTQFLRGFGVIALGTVVGYRISLSATPYLANDLPPIPVAREGE
jgi:hypothetical protein